MITDHENRAAKTPQRACEVGGLAVHSRKASGFRQHYLKEAI